jgi:aerobic carbon-monoxide dehydrogenase small subunit
LNPISIQVNGRRVSAQAEPRTHLGDFLRDELRLTGTHLGCEHGVCGACTVLVDGQPTRSCITFAVACEGREVTTIEGYDEDRVMQLMRQAFTKHHALQCGFCTPGMLATARDIVLRLPDADEHRVRLELSGNLCRCTGYQGIVNAVLDVLQQQRDAPDEQVRALRQAQRTPRTITVTRVAMPAQGPMLGVAGPQSPQSSGVPVAMEVLRTPHQMVGQKTAAESTAPTPTPAADADLRAKAKAKGNTIEASFDVPYPIAQVWEFMGDLPAVASCLPGATIESQEGDKVKGRIAIKFGPMAAAFAGAARLERDDAARRAVLRGAGQDSLSQSRAQGDIAYRLESLAAASTRVHVDMAYALQGPLAQFSRSGLVKDFVRRMVADFGQQVSLRLGGHTEPVGAAPRSIPMAGMLWSVLWNRVRSWFGRPPA